MWFATSRAPAEDPASGYLMAGIIAGFLSLGLVLFIWRLFDENVALAIEKLASEMRARTHAGIEADIDAAPARYLGDLAPAASAMTGALSQSKTEVESTITSRTEQLKAESERISALLSDVQAGLLLCSPDHDLVFYNAQAVALFADTGRPRLQRSVFDLMRSGPVRQTYARLVASQGREIDSELLISTRGGGRSLGAHMRLVSGALGLGDQPGYVLTLRDLTADLDAHIERDRAMANAISRVRGPASTLRPLLDLRAESQDTAALDAQIAAHTDELVQAIQEISKGYDATLTTWWPMQDVRAADLVDGMRAYMAGDGPTVESLPPDMILRCDGYAMTNLLALLAREVAHQGLAETVSVLIQTDGAGAVITLEWQGAPMPYEALTAMLERPVEDAANAQTGRELLDRHGTDIWPEQDSAGRAWMTLPLHEARMAAPDPDLKGHLAARPTVYNFDLLTGTDHAAVDDTPLRDLTYVVFDTETTGLEPQNGDEIVQIAALRVVKGKLVEGEAIDMYVDPERSIPAASTKVHGVSEEMVKGAPTIREAGAYFHRFCNKAVLVAHNAPFDMAFFHRHAPAIGVSFDHPVLDTVLLSAILFGQSSEHTLDALAERFGVVIPEEVRHTAYGDTVATADVFLKMLPMLEAKGMRTYGDVLAEMEKNSRLMSEMKARVGA
ncbi:MAG: 3'-5' exonuclease [Mangrovicoccus sp.]|nr:3'-5' exonuclease [Mangrovicoccus sp.]